MIQEISDAILTGNLYDVDEILRGHLEAGAEPTACLEAMMAGLEETGDLFERGAYFVPELMMAADTFKAGMEVLAPRLAGTPRAYEGTVVLGTVQGDVHDIGKNLVGFMLESSGFRVIDLGTDTPPERFVRAVQEHAPDVLAMSALLTTTMLCMPRVVEALERAHLRDSVKVLIGGAPVSQKFADDIGVDGYAATAPQGVEVIRTLFRD